MKKNENTNLKSQTSRIEGCFLRVGVKKEVGAHRGVLKAQSCAESVGAELFLQWALHYTVPTVCSEPAKMVLLR